MRQIAMLFVLTTLAGCGGIATFPTAKVTGEVQCNGEVVENVVVYFRPTTSTKGLESGKVGQGTTDDDGTFTISTYGKNDGAVIGKNQVIVDAPIPDGVTYKGCDCETHSQKVVQEVEVTEGENHFTITLKPKPPKPSKPSKAALEAQEEAQKEKEAAAAEAAAEKVREAADQ